VLSFLFLVSNAQSNITNFQQHEAGHLP